MKLHPLPPKALELLERHGASPYLIAHHRLVHDCAVQLLEALQGLPFMLPPADREAILFGAATHDIGKATATAELTQPGKTHEVIGESMLLAAGVPENLARFARTHGLPSGHTDLHLNDLLVITADTLWKGKRVDTLLDAVTTQISQRISRDYWSIEPDISHVADDIVERADERLSHLGTFAPRP